VAALTAQTVSLLDTKEGAVFVMAGASSAVASNVFSSGPHGSRYAASIHNVARDWRGLADFERMHGIEGVYVANVVDLEHVPDTTFAAPVDIPKRTVITFDKGEGGGGGLTRVGGKWQGLKAPDVDSRGKPIKCSGVRT
jgi:hypothetical protein